MKTVVEGALHVALRGLSLRQRIIADNVANNDTPGFKARTVHFEDQLRRALDGIQANRAANGHALLQAVPPKIDVAENLVARMDQSSVDLDRELLAMTETAMRYNAVARAMSERLALYRTILSDGRV